MELSTTMTWSNFDRYGQWGVLRTIHQSMLGFHQLCQCSIARARCVKMALKPGLEA